MKQNSDHSLSATRFALAFESFCSRVESESGEPFKDFGSGLAEGWEGYKEWVYHSARAILAVHEWKPSQIGSGSILKKTIDAIEVHLNKTYRNNLVQWDGRYGDKSRTHSSLLTALDSPSDTKHAEQVLFDFYCDEVSDIHSFDLLKEIIGGRYDAIAYLFFLKDWTTYMPVRPTAFSAAFEQLGMPHAMVGKCSWENYTGYLDRLTIVQRELAAYGVTGNRLIDAHSFCWMLARLPAATKKRRGSVRWIQKKPKAAEQKKGEYSAGSDAAPIDFVAVEEANRRVGALAQLRVLETEVERLTEAGRRDLAQKVEDVSAVSALGFDIRSFNDDGSEKLIEVKAASIRNSSWRFFVSENERAKSLQLNGYVFALVQNLDTPNPTIWEFPGAQLPPDALRAVNYEVRIKAP